MTQQDKYRSARDLLALRYECTTMEAAGVLGASQPKQALAAFCAEATRSFRDWAKVLREQDNDQGFI
jgi:hypothetical protein